MPRQLALVIFSANLFGLGAVGLNARTGFVPLVKVPCADPVTVAVHAVPVSVALAFVTPPDVLPLAVIPVMVRFHVPFCLTVNLSPAGPVQLVNVLLVIVPTLTGAAPVVFWFLTTPFADEDVQVSMAPFRVSLSVVVPEAALTAPVVVEPDTVTVSVAANAVPAPSMSAVPAAVPAINALMTCFFI
jgi:hypothetical protein